MPVRHLQEIQVGETINLNVARYIDPLDEMDRHHSVASYPRWVQGLLLRVDALESVYVPWPSWIATGVYPADKIFAGEVVNHGNELSVRGVIHPSNSGWLAFDADAFGDNELNSIADLKAQMGKIGTDEALAHNATLQQFGTFTLRNGVTFS
jgi:hypothetical protein